MKKSRFFYLHPAANAAKIAAIDALQTEYTTYLSVCVDAMLARHRFSIPLRELQTFFPPSERLTSQIVKNARAHAVAIVSGWAASKYEVCLKNRIGLLSADGRIDDVLKVMLYTVGKHSVNRPSAKTTQEALDLYWSWLLDENIVGKRPTISDRCGMRLSEMTSILEAPRDASLASWWLAISTLQAGKRVRLPLSGNPHVKDLSDVSKGILARKDRLGRWRFEVVEKREWEVPEPTDEQTRIGIDVGINVMVATSDGRLLGGSIKPRFNALWDKVKAVRRNRQRQRLPMNSRRLDVLEGRLTGMVKSMAGWASNRLVEAYPQHAFVIEDINLRGCRGSKRFAFKALHHALVRKAPTVAVNCAFTSQTCPSCGYVSRANRKDTKFRCRSCGRVSHADVVGGVNLLGRSEDKQLQAVEHYVHVGAILKERYRARRRDSSSGAQSTALGPSSRGLTGGGKPPHSPKPGRGHE